MAIILPTMVGRCCRCCTGGVHRVGRSRGGAPGEMAEGGLPGAELAAATQVAGVDIDAATRVAGAPGAVESAAAALLQKVRVERRPVWTEARCGTDRDCISDARWQPSFDAAVAGSAGWVNKESSRFVVIRDREGGVVLSQVGPLGVGAVDAGGATRALAGLAVARQEQLVRGR